MNAREELERMIATGIRFTLEPVDSRGFSVKVGDYRHEPVVSTVLPSFEHAVAWLIEQVRTRYPDSDYARHKLIRDAKDFPTKKVS
jgi:hypothetical protein